MRFLTFSDWRVQPIPDLIKHIEKLDKKLDFIVYAGDDIERFKDKNINYFTQLAQLTKLKKILVVIGNDDYVEESKIVLRDKHIHSLDEKPFSFDNYSFIGLSGSYINFELRIDIDEEFETLLGKKLKEQYAQIKSSDKIILITHFPPHGILDIGKRFGQEHIGSQSIRKFIDNNKPQLTICGHCHQFGGRTERVNGCEILNIASHDDPSAEGKFAIIDYNNSHKSMSLSSIMPSRETEPLLYLHLLGYRRLQYLKGVGLSRLEDITEKNFETIIQLPYCSKSLFDLWSKHAETILNNKIVLKNPSKFDYLKSNNLLVLDIETDLSQTTIWLIGIYDYSNDKYIQFFDKDDEKKLLHSFQDFLQKKGKTSIVYYGGNKFDENCIKNSSKKFGIESGPVIDAIWQDLGLTIQGNLLGKFESYKLSDVAIKLVNFNYESDIDGFAVGAMFSKYMLEGINPDWDSLMKYNLEDVTATKKIIDKIREMLNNN